MEMDQLKTQMDQMGAKIDRLVNAVIGDEKFGQEGLVGRVNKLESEQEKIVEKQVMHEAITKDRSKRTNFYIAMAGIFFALFEIIINLLSKK